MMEMAKMIGNEMTLMELNAKMQGLTGSETDIFNYGREYWGDFAWTTKDVEGIEEGFTVDFTVLNPDVEDTSIMVYISAVDAI
jgi:hypothetical protein